MYNIFFFYIDVIIQSTYYQVTKSSLLIILRKHSYIISLSINMNHTSSERFLILIDHHQSTILHDSRNIRYILLREEI